LKKTAFADNDSRVEAVFLMPALIARRPLPPVLKQFLYICLAGCNPFIIFAVVFTQSNFEPIMPSH
jgi:hypothetical protein